MHLHLAIPTPSSLLACLNYFAPTKSPPHAHVRDVQIEFMSINLAVFVFELWYETKLCLPFWKGKLKIEVSEAHTPSAVSYTHVCPSGSR